MPVLISLQTTLLAAAQVYYVLSNFKLREKLSLLCNPLENKKKKKLKALYL
jgi:hypothetical protein